jgi:hypothetical protein
VDWDGEKKESGEERYLEAGIKRTEGQRDLQREVSERRREW